MTQSNLISDQYEKLKTEHNELKQECEGKLHHVESLWKVIL